MIDLDALDDILDAGWNRVSGVRSASARRWHGDMFVTWSVVELDTGWFGARLIYSDEPTDELGYSLLHSCSVGKNDGYSSAPEALRSLLDEIDDIGALDLGDDASDPQPALI